MKIYAKVLVCNSSENLKITKTSEFCSVPQENFCKSRLHWNLIILADIHSFTVNEENPKISQFEDFSWRSMYAIHVKIWKCLKLNNPVPFIKKTLEKSSWHSNLINLTDFHSVAVNEDKLQNQSIIRFLLRLVLCDFGQNLKMTKTSQFFSFIKKTLVNHVYIRIWSSWLTFNILELMKKNFKISQFSIFLLRSRYAILVKTWKWLKLLNSVPFIKETLVNDVYIWIWSSLLTFTVLQWMKTNFKISQFSRFLLKSEYAIHVKIWKWLKLLNSVQFIKKTLVNHLYIWIWSFWLPFTALQWMKKNFKIGQFSRFLLNSLRFWSKFENV